MQESNFSALVGRYQALSTEDLFLLQERRSDLLPEAQLALENEISRRQVQFEDIKQTRATDKAADLAREAKQQELDWRKQAKEYRQYKWGMIIVTPTVAIWFALEPPELLDLRGPKGVLVATILIWWAAEFIRWWLSKKRDVAGDA